MMGELVKDLEQVMHKLAGLLDQLPPCDKEQQNELIELAYHINMLVHLIIQHYGASMDTVRKVLTRKEIQESLNRICSLKEKFNAE